VAAKFYFLSFDFLVTTNLHHMGAENGKNWPSGAHPASDTSFRTNILKATLITSLKWMLEAQFGAPRTKTGRDAKYLLCRLVAKFCQHLMIVWRSKYLKDNTVNSSQVGRNTDIPKMLG